jgi:hypothetical protein
MHKQRYILEKDGDNFSHDKRMGRPAKGLPSDSQGTPYELPVKESIQVFVLDLECDVMRR